MITLAYIYASMLRLGHFNDGHRVSPGSLMYLFSI